MSEPYDDTRGALKYLLNRGWDFRRDEPSVGHWLVIATHASGPQVRYEGDDPEALLRDCVRGASEAQRRIDERRKRRDAERRR